MQYMHKSLRQLPAHTHIMYHSQCLVYSISCRTSICHYHQINSAAVSSSVLKQRWPAKIGSNNTVFTGTDRISMNWCKWCSTINYNCSQSINQSNLAFVKRRLNKSSQRRLLWLGLHNEPVLKAWLTLFSSLVILMFRDKMTASSRSGVPRHGNCMVTSTNSVSSAATMAKRNIRHLHHVLRSLDLLQRAGDGDDPITRSTRWITQFHFGTGVHTYLPDPLSWLANHNPRQLTHTQSQTHSHTYRQTRSTTAKTVY